MNPDTLERLCKYVEDRLEMAVNNLASEGGKIDFEDAKFIEALTHSLKSIKTTMAMEGYGYSEARGRDSMGRFSSRNSYAYGDRAGHYYPMAWDDGSYEGRAYEGRAYRGRSRDGSYEGRAMFGDERQELERMMRDTSDERVKRALQTALAQM